MTFSAVTRLAEGCMAWDRLILMTGITFATIGMTVGETVLVAFGTDPAGIMGVTA